MKKHFPLVRYGCGCIGLPVGEVTEDDFHMSLVVKECREGEIGFHVQGILPQNVKNSVPLTEEEVKSVIQDINFQLREGEKFNQLKGLLR